MSITAKNLLINGLYYGLTVLALPAACLTVESLLGIQRHPSRALWFAGAVLIIAGAALQIWCIVLLQRVGLGTPSPAVPTSRLVMVGPYNHVRNPLNIGEVLVFLGLAASFGSLFLLGYSLVSWIAFHLFIVGVEEPRHHREFGDPYVAYGHNVGRWIPR